MLPAVIPQSIGMGLFFVPITLIATTNVGDEDAGLASGLFNTSQQVGGALGLAVLSTLAADKSASVLGELGRRPSPVERVNALLDGFQVAFIAAAILVAFGAVLLMLARAQAATSRTSTPTPHRCRAPEPDRPAARNPATEQGFALVQRRRRIGGPPGPPNGGTNAAADGRGGESPHGRGVAHARARQLTS